MAITLELDDGLERELRAEAARQGVEPQRVVVRALEERLNGPPTPIPRVSEAEAALLQQVNLGFPSDWWERYEALKAKRRAEALTSEDHACLIEMSDQLEEANAQRMHALVKLARLRAC